MGAAAMDAAISPLASELLRAPAAGGVVPALHVHAAQACARPMARAGLVGHCAVPGAEGGAAVPAPREVLPPPAWPVLPADAPDIGVHPLLLSLSCQLAPQLDDGACGLQHPRDPLAIGELALAQGAWKIQLWLRRLIGASALLGLSPA